MSTWAETTRGNVNKLVADGDITEHNATMLLAMADFCDQHQAVPTDGTIDLWGFGEAVALFAPADGDKGWWTPLYGLAEPLGMTVTELAEAFDEDIAEDWGEHRAARLAFIDQDGEPQTLPVVNHSFVLMLLAGKSPWSSTFADNMLPLFRHAALQTGLADSIEGAVIVDADGNVTETDLTLGDVLRGKDDLPSEEVARHQAFSGPTGPVERGNL
jgi:hypothetical protein